MSGNDGIWYELILLVGVTFIGLIVGIGALVVGRLQDSRHHNEPSDPSSDIGHHLGDKK